MGRGIKLHADQKEKDEKETAFATATVTQGEPSEAANTIRRKLKT